MFKIPALNAVAMQRNINHNRQPAVSSEKPQGRLRLLQQEIDQLVDEFHVFYGGRSRTRSRAAIETFLDYLAGGGYYRQVAFSHGVAKSTAFRYTHDVARFMQGIAATYITLPAVNEFQQLGSQLTAVDGSIKNVILYIDGVIIRIQRPDHAGDAYFVAEMVNRSDSLNVQYVVDKNGQVRHIISGIPGSSHDKTAAEWSQALRMFLNGLPEDTVIMGDAAYRDLHRQVVVPFTGRNLTPLQLQFND